MLEKRQVRYWCFRFKTEAEGGASAEGAPADLQKYFEDKPFFDIVQGWSGFASVWDIEMVDGNPEITPKDKSVWDEWEKHCQLVAKSLPKKKKAVKKVKREKFTESETINVVLTKG